MGIEGVERCMLAMFGRERGLSCWECDDRRIDPEFAMIGFSKTNGVLLLAVNELDLDKSVWASTRK